MELRTQTVEEARALASVIYEGRLDHRPTLKIVIAAASTATFPTAPAT